MRRCVLLSLLVAGCHTTPDTPVLEITPESSNTTHDLMVEVINHQNDLTYGYSWFQDAERVTTITGPVLPASMTARDHVWRVEVTAYGGGSASKIGHAELTISNHRPEVPMVIAPKIPIAGDALVVAVIVWDADENKTETTYRWFRDGELQSQYTTDFVPSGVTQGGELWACEVYATEVDPPKEQGPSNRAEVQIGISRPTIVQSTLTPAEPLTNDTLHVDATIDNPEGLPVTVRYDWYVNDVLVQSRKDTTLSSDQFVKGDKVSVTVVSNDGADDQDERLAGPVTVLNTPPGPPSVRVDPSEPMQDRTLQCLIVAAPSDADGDGVAAYSIAWTVNGEPYTGASTTAFKGDTIDGSVTLGGETWTCTVRAHDGESWGAAMSTSVAVQYPGFRASQVVAARELTCGTATNTSGYTECTNLRVDGLALGNGVDCYKTWVTEQRDTRHDLLCQEITGSKAYWAHYKCGGTVTRTTWNGTTWGRVTDGGFTESLRCGW